MELFTMTLDENGDVLHHILTKKETEDVIAAVEQETASSGDS
jgi:hypothetical protein